MIALARSKLNIIENLVVTSSQKLFMKRTIMNKLETTLEMQRV